MTALAAVPRLDLIAVLDALPAAVAVKDRAHRYVFVNDRFAAMFGRGADEMIGRAPEDLLPSDEAAPIREDTDRALAGEIVESRQQITHNGETHVYAVSRAPLRAADGSIWGTCAFSTDVTEDVAEADRAARALASASDDLQSFAYGVAHDLRSPLRSLSGFTRLLEDEADALSPSGRKYLRRVGEGVRRMDELIDGVLGFSRAGGAALDWRDLDTTEIAERTWASLTGAQPSHAIDFAIEPLARCHGDAALVGQIFANLLANAVKFTAGAGEARVRVGPDGYAPEGFAGYYVSDNGAGFDPAYSAKLFGLFQRLHSAAEFPGNGVGLAIVRRIVGRHDGEIWAESTPGAGATFHFTLPAAHAS